MTRNGTETAPGTVFVDRGPSAVTVPAAVTVTVTMGQVPN